MEKEGFWAKVVRSGDKIAKEAAGAFGRISGILLSFWLFSKLLDMSPLLEDVTVPAWVLLVAFILLRG